jgi:hypothetical protein
MCWAYRDNYGLTGASNLYDDEGERLEDEDNYHYNPAISTNTTRCHECTNKENHLYHTLNVRSDNVNGYYDPY